METSSQSSSSSSTSSSFFFALCWLILFCLFFLLPLYHAGTSCHPSSTSEQSLSALQWCRDHHCFFPLVSLYPRLLLSLFSLFVPVCCAPPLLPLLFSRLCTMQVQAAIPAAFLHEALGRITGTDRSFYALFLLSPVLIPLLLPLLADTSCRPSSTSTWNPRALWYCLMRPAPSP